MDVTLASDVGGVRNVRETLICGNFRKITTKYVGKTDWLFATSTSKRGTSRVRYVDTTDARRTLISGNFRKIITKHVGGTYWFIQNILLICIVLRNFIGL